MGTHHQPWCTIFEYAQDVWFPRGCGGLLRGADLLKPATPCRAASARRPCGYGVVQVSGSDRPASIASSGCWEKLRFSSGTFCPPLRPASTAKLASLRETALLVGHSLAAHAGDLPLPLGIHGGKTSARATVSHDRTPYVCLLLGGQGCGENSPGTASVYLTSGVLGGAAAESRSRRLQRTSCRTSSPHAFAHGFEGRRRSGTNTTEKKRSRHPGS